MVSLHDMRRDARAAFDAAVAAVQPRTPGARIGFNGWETTCSIAGEPLPRTAGRRVVMAIGKAAPGLAAAWLEAAPGWAARALRARAPRRAGPEEVENAATVLRGAHPYPDSDGEDSTRTLLDVAAVARRRRRAGGAAVGRRVGPAGCARDGLTLADIRTTTEVLLRAGAPISEVNTVRRQLLAAAGGGLGRAASPADGANPDRVGRAR